VTASILTGNQGSGKTYEAVEKFILPAVGRRRRVVSNIDGLRIQAIREKAAELYDIPFVETGEIVRVTDDHISAPNFWPRGKGSGEFDDEGNERYIYHDPNRGAVTSAAAWGPMETHCTSFVQPGDLVVIDEGWRNMAADGKISDDLFQYWRMHRHYTKDTASDIVVLTQDIMDIHKKLKGSTRYSYLCKKLDALGPKGEKRYNVWVWEGCNQRKAPMNSEIMNTYRPEIYELYDSYGGGSGGVEQRSDGRTNIFKSGWFIRSMIAMPVIAVVSLGVLYYAIRGLSDDGLGPVTPASASTVSKPVALASPSAVPGGLASGAAPALPSGPGHPIRASAPPVPLLPPKPKESKTWRIAGIRTTPSGRYVMLVNLAGQLRDEFPDAFTWRDGWPVQGVVDGEAVGPRYASQQPSSGGGVAAFGQPPPPPPPR
jgi:zona occludens toxin